MTSSSPRKGFLPLENVLEVITDYDISICINWARSAIEGRNTTLPLTHTQMAKQAGKLGALMFSGTTLNGAYGEWQDFTRTVCTILRRKPDDHRSCSRVI